RRSREELDAHGVLREEAPERAVMLLRENLGRRHETALLAVANRDEERVESDGGLARPDVALKQAVHGLGPAEIAHDLRDRTVLILRELERKEGADLLVELARHGVRGSSRLSKASPPKEERARESEVVIETEPGAGRFESVEGRR